jgi:hypothetical protein
VCLALSSLVLASPACRDGRTAADGSIADGAVAQSGFIFGMHTQSWDHEVDRTIRESAGLGATHTALSFLWSEIEPSPGQLAWDTYDRLVELAGSSGIKVIPQLQYGREGPSSFAPPKVGDYARYAAQVVRRYCDAPGFSRMAQIWNEPNGFFWSGTPEEYAALLDASYAAIKEACPGTVVIGFNLAPSPDLSAWLKRSLASSPRFDWFAWHSYGPPPFQSSPENPYAGEASTLAVRSLLDSHGLQEKPIFDSEKGLALSAGADFIGALLPQAYVALLSVSDRARVRGLTWYLLHDDVFGDGDHGVMGLGRGWTRRPGYCTFKTMTALLPAYRAERQLKGSVDSTDLQVHLFRSDAHGALLALFAPLLAGDKDACTYKVREPQQAKIRAATAASVTKIDWVGRETSLTPDAEGAVALDVTWKPTYVRISLPAGSTAVPEVQVSRVPAEKAMPVPMDPEIVAFISAARGPGVPPAERCFALREWHRGLVCCLGREVVYPVMTQKRLDEITLRLCLSGGDPQPLEAVLEEAYAKLEGIAGQAGCPVSELLPKERQDELLGKTDPKGPGPTCDSY